MAQTDQQIAQAAREMRATDGFWPSARALRERVGGGDRVRIGRILDATRASDETVDAREGAAPTLPDAVAETVIAAVSQAVAELTDGARAEVRALRQQLVAAQSERRAIEVDARKDVADLTAELEKAMIEAQNALKRVAIAEATRSEAERRADLLAAKLEAMTSVLQSLRIGVPSIVPPVTNPGDEIKIPKANGEGHTQA